MEIFISIDGVIRNTIQKFDFHYKDSYLDSESEDVFEYDITEPIQNDNLLNSYKFQSQEEFEYFLFVLVTFITFLIYVALSWLYLYLI